MFKETYQATYDPEILSYGPVEKNSMKLAKTGFVTGTVRTMNEARGKRVTGKAYGVMVGEDAVGVIKLKLSFAEIITGWFESSRSESSRPGRPRN